MPIQFQHGQVSSIAKLAKLAGNQLAARREYERRQEQLQRAQEMQKQEFLASQQRSAQMQLAQYEQQNEVRKQTMAMDWDTQKMALNSQQNFAMEKMREEAFAKRDVAAQIRKMDEYEQGVKKLRELRVNGEISPDNYQYLLTNMTTKVFGDTTYPYPRQEDTLAQLVKGFQAQQVGGQPLQTPTQTPVTPPGQVRVLAPDGREYHIPREDWKEAESKGWKIVTDQSMVTRPEPSHQKEETWRDISKRVKAEETRGSTEYPKAVLSFVKRRREKEKLARAKWKKEHTPTPINWNR